MTRILALTAAALLAATATPALADHREVRFGDLNLASAEGRAALDRRIARAARDVCGVDASSRELSRTMAADRCYRDAIKSSRTQLAAAIAKQTRAAG